MHIYLSPTAISISSWRISSVSQLWKSWRGAVCDLFVSVQEHELCCTIIWCSVKPIVFSSICNQSRREQGQNLHFLVKRKREATNQAHEELRKTRTKWNKYKPWIHDEGGAPDCSIPNTWENYCCLQYCGLAEVSVQLIVECLVHMKTCILRSLK